ncbi:MAG: hypothetical protein PHW12_08080 [Smithella sp.]|nr:hypothetical protein [Smithella sp.]
MKRKELDSPVMPGNDMDYGLPLPDQVEDKLLGNDDEGWIPAGVTSRVYGTGMTTPLSR